MQGDDMQGMEGPGGEDVATTSAGPSAHPRTIVHPLVNGHHTPHMQNGITHKKGLPQQGGSQPPPTSANPPSGGAPPAPNDNTTATTHPPGTENGAGPAHSDPRQTEATPSNGTSGNGEQRHRQGPGVSPEDIQLVQNLIERCLQLYMTRDEVVNILKEQATIDSAFTQLVWAKLEEQNPDFFRCYYTRLKLKAQIVMFNHLLEQQVSVVDRMKRGWNGGAGNSRPASATTSGIPLFQGGAGKGPSAIDHRRSLENGVDMPLGAGSGTGRADQGHGLGMSSLGDGPGPGLLFTGLGEMAGDHELGHLGGGTPGELGFLRGSSPLNLVPGTSPGTLQRNFSLSDLGNLDGGGAPRMSRNFSLSELDDAG